MTSAATTPLTRSAERLAVAALTLAGLSISLNVQVLAPLGPYLRDALALDEDQFGSIVASGWIAGAVGSLLLLPVVDRIGRRGPLLWGLGGFIAASLAHLVVEGYLALLVVRAAAGMTGGAAFTIASASVADLVPYERRAAAMGVFSMSLFLSVPVGMPVANLLAESGNWSAIFAAQAIVGIAAIVGLARTVPRGLGASGLAFDWRILRVPHVVPALLSVALYSGAFATAVQFLGLYLDASGLVPRSEQWSVWIVLGLFSALGALTLTRFADRVGKRVFVIVTSAVVGAGLATLPFVATVAALIAVGLPISICTAARTGAMTALVSGLVGAERRGSIMAVRAVVLSAGMGVVVKAGGALHEAFGYEAMILLAAGCIAASVLLLVRVREGFA